MLYSFLFQAISRSLPEQKSTNTFWRYKSDNDFFPNAMHHDMTKSKRSTVAFHGNPKRFRKTTRLKACLEYSIPFFLFAPLVVNLIYFKSIEWTLDYYTVKFLDDPIYCTENYHCPARIVVRVWRFSARGQNVSLIPTSSPVIGLKNAAFGGLCVTISHSHMQCAPQWEGPP